jgi:small subunit ribosomal protein S4
MKKHGSVVSLSRRLGIALTSKAAKFLSRRAYAPGQHGPGQAFQKSKMSDYKIQLLEKQRLRAQYNIQERQMRNYYTKAVHRQGNTADNLIQLLESRLDSFVLRAGFATTIYAARQVVSHEHFLVNGHKVNIPSYLLKPGDVVTLKEKSRSLLVFQSAIDSANPPSYISLGRDNGSAKYLFAPQRAEVPVICEIPRVVEFYSR